MFSSAYKVLFIFPRPDAGGMLKYTYSAHCITSQNKSPVYITSTHGHQPQQLALYCQKCPGLKENSLTSKNMTLAILGPATMSF